MSWPHVIVSTSPWKKTEEKKTKYSLKSDVISTKQTLGKSNSWLFENEKTNNFLDIFKWHPCNRYDQTNGARAEIRQTLLKLPGVWNVFCFIAELIHATMPHGRVSARRPLSGLMGTSWFRNFVQGCRSLSAHVSPDINRVLLSKSSPLQFLTGINRRYWYDNYVTSLLNICNDPCHND